MTPAATMPPMSARGNAAGRVDGLLGDVGGVLEAGHGEEGESDARRPRRTIGSALRGELQRGRRSRRRRWASDDDADADDDDEAEDLDERS